MCSLCHLTITGFLFSCAQPVHDEGLQVSRFEFLHGSVRKRWKEDIMKYITDCSHKIIISFHLLIKFPISIVLLDVTGSDYDIYHCNYIFDYLSWNNLILLPKCLAFQHLDQSKWADNKTANKIRGSSKITNPLLRVFVSGFLLIFIVSLFCVTMVICCN